jgi:hypothetical protein
MQRLSSIPEHSMQSENFQSFYNTTLRPKLVQIDTQRHAIANKIKLYGAIGIGGGLVFLFFNAGMFPLIIVGAGLYFFYQHHARAFRETYKQNVIRTMITATGLNYDHNSCIQQSEYEKSKLFLKKINRYYGDDYVSGVIGKTAIRFSEVFTQNEQNNGDKKKLETIFRGILFIADFNKKFPGETIVLPDVSENILGGFGSFLQSLNYARPQLVKLEDPDFEKNFVVYSTDQVEARYILSPAFMQRILEFKTRTSARISLSFIDSHVYIAIPINKNLFEAPSLFKSIDNYKQLSEYNGYVQMCVNTVELLDLNTRIWSKE